MNCVKHVAELTTISCKTRALIHKLAMAGPQVTRALRQNTLIKWSSGNMALKNGVIYQVAMFTLPPTGHI